MAETLYQVAPAHAPRGSVSEMRSLDRFTTEKLAGLEAASLRRRLVETFREDGIWVTRDGKRLLSFCCNDYLNLSQHEAVKAAAIEAVRKYGVGSGASRLVTGNHPLFRELETRLARFKGTEAAIVFGSGYLANTGIIPALIGKDDLVLMDELNHACLWAGARVSRAKVLTFPHAGTDAARALLAEHRGRHPRAIVATDGVFSMDGDIAPLARLSQLAQEYDAWLLVDDAHGLGVLGGGRGSAFIENPPVEIPLQMGTLSKAIGGYGAYLCASQSVIDWMHNRARSFVYSTGLPPASAAAALAALDLIERDAALAARPLRKARAFTRSAGLPEPATNIVPILLGEEKRALSASDLLAQEGFLVVAIRPPTVPAGTARLRLTFTAGHPDGEIERLAHLVRTRVLGN
jgi:8-amino-7-oxononanoate synthase